MGLDLIEVSDNGHGIDPSNYDKIALKHYTSKITNFDDLNILNSFGFRGEALNALCELSEELSVITKQVNQSIGYHLRFGKDGRYMCQSICFLRYIYLLYATHI